jgi:hypothetical protein
MFQSYSSVPFTQMMAFMNALAVATPPPNPTTVVLPLADTTSLLHLIVNTPEDSDAGATNLGRAAWVGLTTPMATIQTNCNLEGINRAPIVTAGCYDLTPTTAHVRIGFLANDNDDGTGNQGCCTPDSYVGFGGSDTAGSCNEVSLSAGCQGGNGCGGGPNIPNFGYIFVR